MWTHEAFYPSFRAVWSWFITPRDTRTKLSSVIHIHAPNNWLKNVTQNLWILFIYKQLHNGKSQRELALKGRQPCKITLMQIKDKRTNKWIELIPVLTDCYMYIANGLVFHWHFLTSFIWKVRVRFSLETQVLGVVVDAFWTYSTCMLLNDTFTTFP